MEISVKETDPLTLQLGPDIMMRVCDFIEYQLLFLPFITCSSWYHPIRKTRMSSIRAPSMGEKLQTATRKGYLNIVKTILDASYKRCCVSSPWGSWDSWASSWGDDTTTQQIDTEFHSNLGTVVYNNSVAGHMDILQYLMNTYPKIMAEKRYGGTIYAITALNGYFECLEYYHKNTKCPFGEYSAAYCQNATSKGYLDCLKYLHENGCNWDFRSCENAAKGGYIDCLKYLHENGCEWYASVCISAAVNGQLECLKYLHENGCPWNDTYHNTILVAILTGHLECLKYACENGCPIPLDIVEITLNIEEAKEREMRKEMKRETETQWGRGGERQREEEEKRKQRVLDCLHYLNENNYVAKAS